MLLSTLESKKLIWLIEDFQHSETAVVLLEEQNRERLKRSKKLFIATLKFTKKRLKK